MAHRGVANNYGMNEIQMMIRFIFRSDQTHSFYIKAFLVACVWTNIFVIRTSENDIGVKYLL